MAISLLDGGGAVEGASMEHEQELVSRIRSGDVAAFEAVYTDFTPRLLQFDEVYGAALRSILLKPLRGRPVVPDKPHHQVGLGY